jgi:hypothetical protein
LIVADKRKHPQTPYKEGGRVQQKHNFKRLLLYLRTPETKDYYCLYEPSPTSIFKASSERFISLIK